RIDVRHRRRPRDRWPPSVPVRARDDGLRDARPRHDAGQGEGSRSSRARRALLGRRPAIGIRAVPGWLHRGDSRDRSQVMVGRAVVRRTMGGEDSTVESAWAPLSRAVFRALWIASLVSNIGTWMQNVGAAWAMTSLSPSPLMVALVQSATSL